MFINITEYLANSLLDIFSMDLSYFESSIPVTHDIVNIAVCVGWALLLGNLVFQAMKTMATGLGFEGEDPKTLFGRTFVMSFLLLGSRQICDIGLGITKKVITMLQVPDIVQVPSFEEADFAVPGDASWLLVIIVGIILIVQIVKLFFEIGERYVIVAILTILSPLAFAMGGSKNTADIFKGWVRMFASMCLMMVLSIVFLKLILSAMSVLPTGLAVIPWTIFIVALARMGRKIDGVIARIGLNPAITGDPLGHSRIPGMLSLMVMKNMAGSVSKVAGTGKAASAGKPAASGTSASAAPVSRTGAPVGAVTTGTGASGTAPAGTPPTPMRPPIGSSAPGTLAPASSSAPASASPASPAPVSSGHTAPAGSKPADTAVHRDSSSAPPLGRESSGTVLSPETGTHVSGAPSPSRPPIAGTRTADRPVITKSTAAGTHTGTRASGRTPEKTSAAGTPGIAPADRPPVSKSASSDSYGDTAAHEKTAGIKPPAERPSGERISGAKPTDVSPRTAASPADKPGTPPARPDIGSHGTDFHRAVAPTAAKPVDPGSASVKGVSVSSGAGTVPTAGMKTTDGTVKGSKAETVTAASPITSRPSADIKPSEKTSGHPAADTRTKTGAESTDSGKIGVPPSSSVKAGMPLADKIRPAMPSTERTSSVKPSAGKSESSADKGSHADSPVRPPRMAAGVTDIKSAKGMPAPASDETKTAARTRPAGSTVIGKAGDVTAKGASISQSITSVSDVTLNQKAVLPKRESPGVTTALGGHARPTMDRISHGAPPSRKDDKKSPDAEAAKSGSHTAVHSAGETSRTASSHPAPSKSAPEHGDSGGVHKSYGSAETRPEDTAAPGHHSTAMSRPAPVDSMAAKIDSPATKPPTETASRATAGGTTAASYSPRTSRDIPGMKSTEPGGKGTERKPAGRKSAGKRHSSYKPGGGKPKYKR